MRRRRLCEEEEGAFARCVEQQRQAALVRNEDCFRPRCAQMEGEAGLGAIAFGSLGVILDPRKIKHESIILRYKFTLIRSEHASIASSIPNVDGRPLKLLRQSKLYGKRIAGLSYAGEAGRLSQQAEQKKILGY